MTYLSRRKGARHDVTPSVPMPPAAERKSQPRADAAVIGIEAAKKLLGRRLREDAVLGFFLDGHPATAFEVLAAAKAANAGFAPAPPSAPPPKRAPPASVRSMSVEQGSLAAFGPARFR